MKRLATLLSTLFFLSFGLAHSPAVAANDDLQARVQAEVDDYISKIDRLRGVPLFDAADLLTGTGLSNTKLYGVVEKKTLMLLEEHKANINDKIVTKELVVVARALGSMDSKSRDVLQKIQDESQANSMKRRAKNIMARLDWYKKRNELMQNPDYYEPDQDLMTHRYLNLLDSNDSSIRRWAAQELRRRGGTEPVVYAKIAEIIERDKYITGDRHELDSLAWMCRILKEFDRTTYADLLNSVSGDSKVHKKVRKYARL